MKDIEPKYIGTRSDVIEEIRVQNAQVHDLTREAFMSRDRFKIVNAISEVVAVNRLHTQVVREVILRR